MGRHSGAELVPRVLYHPARIKCCARPSRWPTDSRVIVSDVVIPPNATVPRHYHPGEEFIYVIEGSAVHVEEGTDEFILSAGDAYVIPPPTIHEPRGGPSGARAYSGRS